MKIGVLTSGGDAQGMNVAIQSIVKANELYDHETVGILRGFNGFFNEEYITLTSKDVGHIYKLGGSFLLAGRTEALKTIDGRERVVSEVQALGLDVLIVIGGNGSLHGASRLSEMGVSVIGIPATIDNDVYESDYAIGFDTSLNVISNSLDNIRDTAISHDRTHVVEVMGRDCGLLALHGGRASFAEYIIVPEMDVDYNSLCEDLLKRRAQGFTNHLIVVAEGADSAQRVSEEITKRARIKTTVTVLGQIQRGGKPTAYERLIARQFAEAAIKTMMQGDVNVFITLQDKEVKLVSLSALTDRKKVIDLSLLPYTTHKR